MKLIYTWWAWLFGRPSFVKLNKLMFNLSIRGLGVYNYENISISGEKWLIQNKVKNLGKNIVIFDVGAHTGGYAKCLIDEGVDARRIYCFEPNPKTFKKLNKNTMGVGNIVQVESALSDLRGEIVLYDRGDQGSSEHASLSEAIFSEVHKVSSTKENVKVDTLDFYCENYGIETIDFLKIDVEGFELNVLKGGARMLKYKKIGMIQFEFTQINSTVGVFFKQFFDLLSNDFYLYRLLPNGLQAIEAYEPTNCEIFGYQNYVAILKSGK